METKIYLKKVLFDDFELFVNSNKDLSIVEIKQNDYQNIDITLSYTSDILLFQLGLHVGKKCNEKKPIVFGNKQPESWLKYVLPLNN